MRKSVSKVFPPARKHWVGDGFEVNPVFSDLAFSKHLSPFLMFDYGSPKKFKPTHQKLGVGMHPHRGFETVTIAFQGEIEHSDSKGNTGKIGSGDVQWMTAGSGIFHEEFHSKQMAKEGGTLEMCQLWVNLPARLKMVPPRYQAIASGEIPVVPLPKAAGHVRVIAGRYNEQKGAAQTEFEGAEAAGTEGGARGHVDLWDVSVNPSQTIELPIPEGHMTLVFVRRGACTVNKDTKLGLTRVALLSNEGNVVHITTGSEPTSLLIMSGQPIVDANGNLEPVAARGPMVMNTDEELYDAMRWASAEQSKFYR